VKRVGPRIGRWLVLVASASPFVIATMPGSPSPNPPQPSAAQQSLRADFTKTVQPFLKSFCAGCHSGKTGSGGFSIDSYKNLDAIISGQAKWDLAARHVRTKHMPPVGQKQPNDAQRTAFVSWVERMIADNCEIADAGRVTIRRLNREEYNNTVRDLLGVNLRPADDFPSDDVGYGFDNVGDVLTISPLLMEKYLWAAERLARAAIRVDEPRSLIFEMSKAPLPQGASLTDDGEMNMFARATHVIRHEQKGNGSYRLRIVAWGQQAGPEPCYLRVDHNGKPLQQFTVSQTAEKAGTFEVPVDLLDGNNTFSLTFLNDYYNPDDPNPKNRDRNLILRSVELFGPIVANTPLPESHKRIITVYPQGGSDREAARTVLSNFASRAYRRPATPAEVDRLMQIYLKVRSQGDAYEKAIQVCVTAVLVSPHFLFRVELDQNPSGTATQQDVGDFELASRLSYFLWSTMPDEALTSLAKQGKLRDPAVLSTQVDRMLKDPKARALADNFAAQWLQLRKLETLSPDPKLFAGYSEQLKQSMIMETKLFFQAIVTENRPITEFLHADYTYVNPLLAKHYGLPPTNTQGFQRVSLAGTERGGLLTHASVLTVTSNPNRTSPVKRGKWVLEEILGAPPPPPPPDVGVLPDDVKVIAEKSIRERLEAHRKNPACANCHQSMDAIGFSLENFDAVGAFRTQDGVFAVDNRGDFPDGTTFRGSKELKAILLKRKSDFTRCLAEKMLVYATGRGLRTADNCIVDEIVKSTTADSLKMQTLIKSVVLSDAFRKRSVVGGKP